MTEPKWNYRVQPQPVRLRPSVAGKSKFLADNSKANAPLVTANHEERSTIPRARPLECRCTDRALRAAAEKTLPRACSLSEGGYGCQGQPQTARLLIGGTPMK
jgi:hypothetical protein